MALPAIRNFAISVVIFGATSVMILDFYKHEFTSSSIQTLRGTLFTNLKSIETRLYTKGEVSNRSSLVTLIPYSKAEISSKVTIRQKIDGAIILESKDLHTRYDDRSDTKMPIKGRENELLHNNKTDMLQKNSNPKMSVTDNKWKENTIKVGVLIPSTSRRTSKPSLKTFSLTSIGIPSLLKTLEQNYSYTIYVGINDDDFFLTNHSHELENMYPSVSLRVVSVKASTFTATCNGIALRAYRDGIDYMLRINDDTIFKTKNWTTIGINMLISYNPPNIGVVGPNCQQGNTNILTHDMVHRTHLAIFGYYYPPQFDNWWSDDWITRVYEPDRSTKLLNWLVIHRFKHGTRYEVDFKKQNLLSGLLKYDKDRLNKFMKKETLT